MSHLNIHISPTDRWTPEWGWGGTGGGRHWTGGLAVLFFLQLISLQKYK